MKVGIQYKTWTCHKCGKETLANKKVFDKHKCMPFQKYDRSKKIWVNKDKSEYNQVEFKKQSGERPVLKEI